MTVTVHFTVMGNKPAVVTWLQQPIKIHLEEISALKKKKTDTFYNDTHFEQTFQLKCNRKVEISGKYSFNEIILAQFENTDKSSLL